MTTLAARIEAILIGRERLEDVFTSRRPQQQNLMAARQSLIRPLRTAVSVARSVPTSNAVRAFATSACRAKEIAGNADELPNMRHARRDPAGPLKAPIVNPTGKFC